MLQLKGEHTSALRSLTSVAIGFPCGVALTAGVSYVFAWTGPTQAPPNGNVSAPVNVGTTDQVKNTGLSLNALVVFGNTLLSGVSRYLNFGTTPGSAGYGIRDNGGTMEFKNNGGAWDSMNTSVQNYLSLGQVTEIKFTNGSVQTTAYPGSGGAESGTLCGMAVALGTCSSATMTYTSVATCKGASVVSSCSSGYTLKTWQTGITGTCQTSGAFGTLTVGAPINSRTCVKN